MLDVRPIAYKVPVAEQEFTSLTPIIQIANYGTVDALVTGHIYIYRDSTGLKLYTSELVITTILANTVVDVSALSPWSPPAPADDDYFVMCDITAVAVQEHEPPSIVTQLGPYTFDIKPVGMGPAPAAHGVTHENGGSDELDVTDLSGLLDDPQTPLAHAASHEAGQADALEIVNLGTAEMDDSLVLAPDGAGGVEFRAEGEGTPTSYIQYEDDCWSGTAGHSPWVTAAISSGTASSPASSSEHPGLMRFTSSTSANSGHRIAIAGGSFLLAGSEQTDMIIRPLSLTDTTIRAGFLDTTGSAAPADGCYFHMDPTTAKITGRTMSNSAGSTTGTDFQAVTNTWYHLRIAVNADASRVDFYIFDEAGTQLWTDYLTTNIPTGAGRNTGNGIIATNSGTTAVNLIDIDYISAEIARTLVR